MSGSVRSGVLVVAMAILLITGAAAPVQAVDPGEDDLAAAFPSTLEDQSLEVETWSGAEWIDAFDANAPGDQVIIRRTRELLQTVGRSLDDLTIAMALHESTPGDIVTIAAIRVDGAQASHFVDPAIRLMHGMEYPEFLGSSEDRIGGKDVVRVREGSIPGESAVTFYGPTGDTLWVTDAQKPLLARILKSLPSRSARLEFPEHGIAMTWPEGWHVEVEPGRMQPDPESSDPIDLLGSDEDAWSLSYGRGEDFPGECDLQLYESARLTLDDFVDWHRAYESLQEGLVVEFIDVERSGDPASTEVAAISMKVSFGEEHFFDVLRVVVDGGDAIAMLKCGGAPPLDDWASTVGSIAETIEFLDRDDGHDGEDPSVAPAVAAIASQGCGTSAVASGIHTGTMEVADLERSWAFQVPSAHDGQTPVPLVLSLHGNDIDTDDGEAALGRFGPASEEHGFVVVAPEARRDPVRWMWELDEHLDLSTSNPDITFIEELIDGLGEELCLDLARVYATGYGDGGYGASALGCVLPERISAIATVAGIVEYRDACDTTRPVPVLAIHGERDRVRPWDGGLGRWVREPSPTGQSWYELPVFRWDGWAYSPGEWAEQIAWRNGCQRGTAEESIAEGVWRQSWLCPTDGSVELLVHRGKHSWDIQGAELDTTEEIWEFFEGHPMSPSTTDPAYATAIGETDPGAAGAADDGSPVATTEALRSRLSTIEVEPGVFRVANDGIRDLSGSSGKLVAGLDGSVWLFTADGFFRFGDEGHAWQRGKRVTQADIEVGPDGTVWAVGVARKKAGKPFRADLRSFDGSDWTVRLPSTKQHRIDGVEVQPDGSVWASWIWGGDQDAAVIGRLGGGRSVLARNDVDRWEQEAGFGKVADMWAAGEELWVAFEDFAAVGRRELGAERHDLVYGLVFHDGADWFKDWRGFNELDVHRGARSIRWADVGPDGTVWLGSGGREGAGTPTTRLARFDGSEWAEWDGVVGGVSHAVAPDGSLWARPGGAVGSCTGIANFDGTEWTEYLSGHCVDSFDVGPDGTVWLQSRVAAATGREDDAGPVETHFIRRQVPGAAP